MKIKFRAYCKSTDTFDFWEAKVGKEIWINSNHEEPELFSGIEDENKNEIYHNDIIEFRANYSSQPCGYMKALVQITPYGIKLHSENGFVYDPENEADEFPYNKCNLIGNIWHNVKLAKLFKK